MKTIRQAIKSQLTSIHPRVYFLKSPDNAQFPYLVYTIQITDLSDNLKMVTLDVDGWDNKEDTTELEDLMVSVKNGLNRQVILNDNLFMSMYLDRQLVVPDDNPELSRRTNIFLGRLYER
ncbi:hypothetical protein FB550_102425 [Neobacillus bataviensis]|uniref:Uncharacterized protein n=1 Tax=Neobacillus bataviensis TaxID=220685 RepID=A0A561DSQ7_9BACI|nr:hypothetical protein [Neobacillus bataviensis]TWE06403.1 hypothetical protein FB550_102425 [Neobacillus bataviensis]